jgi:hypothetical protein
MQMSAHHNEDRTDGARSTTATGCNSRFVDLYVDLYAKCSLWDILFSGSCDSVGETQFQAEGCDVESPQNRIRSGLMFME